MIYRIIADMLLDTEDSALDLLDKLHDVQDHAITINPGQPNEERSKYEYQQCFHDEALPHTCISIEKWSSNG